MPLHNTLEDAELHENKGVAGASNNTVATAVSGATSWAKIKSTNIDQTNIFNVNEGLISSSFVDVSTAETVYLTFPFDCTIVGVYTVLHGSITTANSTLTVKNHAGSSMGTITVAYSGSAAGDVDSLTPTSNNTLTAGQKMSIETDGGSSAAAKLSIFVWYTIQS